MFMTTKKSRISKFYTRRSYEPVKMTIAVAALAATALMLLAIMMFAI